MYLDKVCQLFIHISGYVIFMFILNVFIFSMMLWPLIDLVSTDSIWSNMLMVLIKISNDTEKEIYW